MKNIFGTLLFIVFSLTPYGFFIMYWDYEYGSFRIYIAGYVLSLVIGILASFARFHKGFLLFPVISCVVSYVFLQMYSEAKWNNFFKPFGAETTLILLYLISLLSLSFGFLIGKRKKPSSHS